MMMIMTMIIKTEIVRFKHIKSSKVTEKNPKWKGNYIQEIL